MRRVADWSSSCVACRACARQRTRRTSFGTPHADQNAADGLKRCRLVAQHKALRKEPKWYLRDHAMVEDTGKRTETLIACHLLKAVDYYRDEGFGVFELRYLRDKDKREVDFLIVRDKKPWVLVEAKHADRDLSPALAYFQAQVGAPHALQVVVDMPYAAADCFAQHSGPLVVPARTLLSQLV